MPRPVLLLAVLAATLTSCGGQSAEDVLSETASNLSGLESGTMTMRLVASAAGGEQTGFELEGPFSFAGSNPLPVADIAVTQIAGSEQGTTRFLSTGENAFLEVEGAAYELPAEEFASGGSGSGGQDDPLGELDIGDWFVDPTMSDGNDVGGDATDRVRSRLDVVAAINDLLSATREIGGFDVANVEGPNAEQLRRAVKSATVEVLTGKEDRLLRRLALNVDLGVDLPDELRSALGSLAGAQVEFELTIANPNEPVEKVEEPANAVPYPGG